MKKIGRILGYFMLITLFFISISCKVEAISCPIRGIIFCKDLKKVEERWRKKLLKIEKRGKKIARWYDQIKMMCEDEIKKKYPGSTQTNGVLDIYESLKLDSIKCFKVQYLTFYPLTIGTYGYSKKVVFERKDEINVYDMSEWMRAIKDIENKYGRESEIAKRIKFFLKKEFKIHTNF